MTAAAATAAETQQSNSTWKRRRDSDRDGDRDSDGDCDRDCNNDDNGLGGNGKRDNNNNARHIQHTTIN